MDYIIYKQAKKKTKKNYFTQETENAIIKYNNTTDSYERSKIYEDNIHYPFFKLTQNIIHTFKFYYTEVDNLEDLQHEIMIFLLEKIHKYSHKQNIQDKLEKIIIEEFGGKYDKDFVEYIGEADIVKQHQIDDFIGNLEISEKCREKLSNIKPPKAYSYFGTIVKNWLIIYNDKNYKKKINNTSLDDIVNYSNLDISDPSFIVSNKMNEGVQNITKEGDLNTSDLKYEDYLSLFMDEYIEYITENIYEIFPKEYDSQIADAILELFRKRQSIDIFNKKALYIYIREMIDVKTPKITKIANKLYAIFKEKYLFYLENGYSQF